MVKHELAGSAYNARRADCEAGVRLLATVLPHVSSLRDVSWEELERLRPQLSEVVSSVVATSRERMRASAKPRRR